jgi:bifunctional non-homologous end joining protein LigD
MERRALLQNLIKRDPRSPLQFSDHVDADGARFFKAAAELGLEGIVCKRAASRYRSGPSRSWLKTKNMVESEFILLGTERDSDGVPWALLASDPTFGSETHDPQARSCDCRPSTLSESSRAASALAGRQLARQVY